MAWAILLISGVFEAVWAIALDASQGFKKLKPTIVFIIGSLLSIAGLAIAMRELPTGTSYAVWTATGATITVIYSMATGQEKATVVRLFLILGLVTCVVGLKAVS
ncbi:MAG: multidrug efflux SMR transporter [Actinomycetaceae bacterium]|nr:multidrug efflux SMR transporter [Actinomycetaceae bacterium]